MLGYGLTWVVWRLSKKYNLYTHSTNHQIHSHRIARFGGIAIFLSLAIGLSLWLPLDLPRIGLLISLAIIFSMGLIDDLINLKPWLKLFFQLMAVSVAIGFGIRIGQINNPFGSVIIFSPGWDIVLSSVWLLLVTNTMNLLDGLDGLAGGTTAIAAVIFFFLSWLPMVNQPETALLAVVLLGVILGFLRWNWYPAKIFMGDAGSNVLGFLLGAMAIISGAKLATAALVLGFPILDLIWAVVRRVRAGKHPFLADQAHLHHRFLAAGIAHPKAVIVILAIIGLFGAISLLSGAIVKLGALAGIGLLMIIVYRIVLSPHKQKKS